MKAPAILHTPVPDDSGETIKKIGLIAGQGDFPLLIARAAKANGTELIAICINGFTPPKLQEIAHKAYWLDLGQLGKAIETLKAEGIAHLVMAGRIPHSTIFQYRHFDWRAMKLLARAASKRADDLMRCVCEEFAKDGIQVVESSAFLRHLMPSPGLLTPARPLTQDESKDVEFGLPIAKHIAGLDVGQTIVVKDRIVVAVEGVEGTDKCIRRAGDLAGPGCIVVKVSKPNQDLRFDIPIVGPGTIKSMITAGATVLALSSGRSLIFHREEVVSAAQAAGINITVIDDEKPYVAAVTK